MQSLQVASTGFSWSLMHQGLKSTRKIQFQCFRISRFQPQKNKATFCFPIQITSNISGTHKRFGRKKPKKMNLHLRIQRVVKFSFIGLLFANFDAMTANQLESEPTLEEGTRLIWENLLKYFRLSEASWSPNFGLPSLHLDF